MILGILCGVVLGAALVAVFAGQIRTSALALWVASLGVGGIYITVGAEALAVVQWIVSTLVAISFVFFAATFGDNEVRRGTRGLELMLTLLTFTVGIAFASVLYWGSREIAAATLAVPEGGNDLLSLGRELTEKHLLSLEILAISLFIVLIGGGTVARPETEPEGPEWPQRPQRREGC